MFASEQTSHQQATKQSRPKFKDAGISAYDLDYLDYPEAPI
jgi:hypothetical protein